MKKILLYLVGILFIGAGSLSFALAAEKAKLPSAGLKPENLFYFMDGLGEMLQEMFTFEAEDKARLQVVFASERIAEIRATLATKGITAKELPGVEKSLLNNVQSAAIILEREKAKGKDVRALAKELSDKFELRQKFLRDVFREEKMWLQSERNRLTKAVGEARRAGLGNEVRKLIDNLSQVTEQEELLEVRKGENFRMLTQLKAKLDAQLAAKERTSRALRTSQNERRGLVYDAARDGIAVPREAFAKFDKLIKEAKELFEKGEFDAATGTAFEAYESLSRVDEAVEGLYQARTREEEAKLAGGRAVEDDGGLIKRVLGQTLRSQGRVDLAEIANETRKAEEKLFNSGDG